MNKKIDNYEHQRRYGWNLEINRYIARELKKKREELGISQPEMARRMETTQATVSRIERSEDNLTLTKLDRYVKALGIDITLQFPINDGRQDILCKLFQTHSDYSGGTHFAKYFFDGELLRPLSSNFKAHPPISGFTEVDSIIHVSSFKVLHKLFVLDRDRSATALN